MEILLAIALGGAMVVGSLAGFFALFTKGDKEAKMRNLEKQLANLSNRLAKLEQQQDKTNAIPTINVEKSRVVAPNITIAPEDSLNRTLPEAADTISPITSLNEETVMPALNEQTSINLEITEPYQALAPVEPNIIDKALNYAKDWLFGGNTLVRSGIVLLFIGVSFLIKYVAEHTTVPIELRMAGIALFGAGLLIVGWRLRHQRKQYAWALQGGGIGVLYLTVFASMKLYQLLPASAAFILLTMIALLSAAIAVLQSALPLAILGFSGGFLAPIFTASGSGSHVGLFSYYLILNVAIAFIAYYKSWRPLNVLGFAFTFVVGSIWGAASYQPAYFTTTEPFLIVHFLLFTLVAILYAHRQATTASDYVDATLVFGTPLVGFSLQYALLRDTPFGLAYSALGLAIFYMALAWWVLKHQRHTLQFLGECFLALGIGFATLTLPLALDGRWTSAAWAVEGVGLLWVGLKQNRLLPTLSGLALQLLGAVAFAFGWGLTSAHAAAHQHLFLGVAFIAIAGWACGALLNHFKPAKWSLISNGLAMWGWLWWVGAGLTAIDRFLPNQLTMHAALGFIAITSLLLPIVAKRIQWSTLALLSLLLLPTMILASCYEFISTHPFANIGLITWLIAFAVYINLLAQKTVFAGDFLRAPIVWIGAIILGLEWHYQLHQLIGIASVWRDIGWAVVPMGLIASLSYWQFKDVEILEDEPLAQARTWGWLACAPLMIVVIAWFFYMSLNANGNAAPLPYIPFLNPLDIALIGAILLFLIWFSHITKHFYAFPKVKPIVSGIMAFTLLNGILLRTLHHWMGTPFRWVAILDYPIVQMAFTFMWAMVAFILMLLAHKKSLRILWIVGAALMALVVAKIFLLDLAQSGTIERIASFIGAGIMLLIMGYFAPLPPAKQTVEPVQEVS